MKGLIPTNPMLKNRYFACTHSEIVALKYLEDRNSKNLIKENSKLRQLGG